MTDYALIAKDARKKVLSMIYNAQVSHIGSNFSAIDILAVLFEKTDLKKDEVILSAGWKAAAWYYFLARKGIIPVSDLDTYCQEGSNYIGLTEPKVKGVEFAGGSMGMGLPASVGFALAKKLKGEKGKVYCLMSDGEQHIGTTHESALIASHHKLDNLCIFIDYNEFCATGKTNEILNIEPLANRWISWGWTVYEIDGHNFQEIDAQFENDTENNPTVIIAKTIKGYPISFMSGNNLFHYKNLSKDEYEKALQELNG